MQYDEFRNWLEARGGNPNSVDTRSSAVRKIEKELGALGSSHPDLDAAFDDDQFSQLRNALDDMRADAKASGTKYRALFPGSNDPLNRISNSRAWLGQYAQFRRRQDSPSTELNPLDSYWFVGASFGGKNDQTDRFLHDSIWEISTPKPAEADLVRSMKVGDRIAIKATFVQKHNLPFENRGQSVSVMRIKARGIITDNPGDGERVSVSWDEEFDPKDWYFYTFRPTIWELHPDGGHAEKLIEFTFFDEAQDIGSYSSEWAGAPSGTDVGPTQRFWIEKTIVAGRPDRMDGEHAVGRALRSPQTSKDGKNIYANMLEVQPGDVIFHLTDNDAITSVSIAGDIADQRFVGLADTDWAGQPGFRVPLEDHEPLDPALPRQAFLETEPFATELTELHESGAKGLFYNKRGLNQGAY